MNQGQLIKSHNNQGSLGMKVKARGCSWPDMIPFAKFLFGNLLKQVSISSELTRKPQVLPITILYQLN